MCVGGEHRLIENKSIPRGCSLSPLLGSSFIYSLSMNGRVKNKIDYVRYMDDVVILTKTRHQLKRALKSVYRYY